MDAPQIQSRCRCTHKFPDKAMGGKCLCWVRRCLGFEQWFTKVSSTKMTQRFSFVFLLLFSLNLLLLSFSSSSFPLRSRPPFICPLRITKLRWIFDFVLSTGDQVTNLIYSILRFRPLSFYCLRSSGATRIFARGESISITAKTI